MTKMSLDKQVQPVDTKPKTAVYSTLHNKKDKRAVELLRLFCLFHNLNCVFYLDKRIPKPDAPSQWQNLLDDVTNGKLETVMTWLSAPDMQQFCEGYNTRFVELDIFDWFKAMRTSKADTVPLYKQGKL